MNRFPYTPELKPWQEADDAWGAELRRVFGREACNARYQVRGRGTALLSRCEPGDHMTLLGPLGHGFRLPDLRGRVAIVTGGIGIAPMRGLAEQLLPQHVTLMAGFRGTPRLS